MEIRHPWRDSVCCVESLCPYRGKSSWFGGRGVHGIKDAVSLWDTVEGGRLIQRHSESLMPFRLAGQCGSAPRCVEVRKASAGR